MKNLPEQIQRLVDGQLEDDERSRLLGHIDQQAPQHWRDLALGFVEAQLFAGALRSARVDRSRRSRPRVWAVAAALVLGLALGVLVPEFNQPAAELSVVPEEDGPVAKPRGVRNIGEIREAGLRIPVLDGTGEPAEAERILQASGESMRRISAACAEQGLRPSLNTSYIMAELENGGRIILPVNHLAIGNHAPDESPSNN